MQPNLYREKHRVTYYETGPTNHVTIAMLLNLVILASEDQRDALNLNVSNNLGWVVIQDSIWIHQLPVNNQLVELSTQSACYNRLLAYREFWVKDASGHILAYVKSQWILLNLKRRKLTMIPDTLVRPYRTQKVTMIPHLKRPRLISGSANVFRKKYRVRFNDIDVNRHVNNSRYLEWMCDALPIKFLLNHQPEVVNVRFKNEVNYGQVVKSQVQVCRTASGLVTRHEIRSSGKLNAVANLKWA